MRCVCIAVLLGSPTVAASAQELTERLDSPVRHTLTSNRLPHDLELFGADAITQRGGLKPTVIRNGEHDVIVFGYEQSPTIAVSLSRVANGTRLEVRTRGRDMADRLVTNIRERCGERINP